MNDERTQLRQRAEMAEADAAALRQLIEQYLADVEMSPLELRKGIRPDHPGAAILAVAEAARAYVQANDYDNLADLLVALKGAVDRWER